MLGELSEAGHCISKEFYKKTENLETTDDRKTSEEPHGASDEAKLGLELELLVSFNLVKGGRVKVDLN